MSDAVLEMYQSLDEENKLAADEFIKKLAQNQETKRKNIIAEFEKLRGSISEEDAEIAYAALAECRKIDYGEW